uniref:Uncharacterized protein LOC104219772 n=1 Tax=Nicotiana sylvestris TaxID=4096 RepID=A0A1U7VQW6_NICSY|nr:PREDICTED: uncharacterized protein LOC104219772 [Nicotiana sylvestris]
MRGFAKYLKDLITKKRTTKNEVVNVTHRVSSIITTTTFQKKEDPEAFTIPCTIGLCDFARALCDNGSSINLMPLVIYKQTGLGMPRPTSMRLQMADRSIKRLVGIVDDVLMKIKFQVNDEEVTFQEIKGMKLPHAYESISVIDIVDEVEDTVEVNMEEECLGEALAAILANFDGEDMEGYMESVNALEGLGS